MGLWARYIAWIDRDLDANFPTLNSTAALVPVLPVLLAVFVRTLWDPPEPARTWLAGAVIVSVAALFGIWLWRVVDALFLRPPG
ncbi:hypothetical protein P1X14_17280 [Sphingomonas sp. AOB5]|uniref:hypothetical protein n=1 Tax=Sphingomonas sp. AOB5 TaxID=3034017 RepID=UPI0023F89155|nr:hypothetical protein [Sphingomonas sp. AOB5]MDF7777013.1 hypothetical protein [Sphingomonas sp. AOB5]